MVLALYITKLSSTHGTLYGTPSLLGVTLKCCTRSNTNVLLGMCASKILPSPIQRSLLLSSITKMVFFQRDKSCDYKRNIKLNTVILNIID